MLSTLRQGVASLLPSNSRARRRQESGPAQGPPGTQSVTGPRTSRGLRASRISIRVPLRQSYPPLTLWIPLPPLRSPYQRVGGMRGREVPPRTAVVRLARHLPHSASVQHEHPAALRSSAAGSLLAVTPLPPQAPSEESRPSTPRYGFAVVKPGRYSSRPPPG